MFDISSDSQKVSLIRPLRWGSPLRWGKQVMTMFDAHEFVSSEFGPDSPCPLGHIQLDAMTEGLDCISRMSPTLSVSVVPDDDEGYPVLRLHDARRPDELIAEIDPYTGYATVHASSVVSGSHMLEISGIIDAWQDTLIESF